MHHAEDGVRIKADHEHEQHERQRRGHFTQVHIGKMFVVRIGYLAERNTLVEPEHVPCAEDDAEGCYYRVRLVVKESAEQDRELANKPVSSRKTDRRQG